MMLGHPVKCHGNLTRRCLSVKQGTNPTVQVRDSVVTLTAATFRVQPAGHARIIRRGEREIVARVHGTVESVVPCGSDEFYGNPAYRSVSYNPKPEGHPERAFFYTVDDGQPVLTSDRVFLVVSDSVPTRTHCSCYVEA